MSNINPIPQAVTALTGPSPVSKPVDREKLPIDGQKIPPGPEQEDVKSPEKKRETLKEEVNNLNLVAKNLNRDLRFSVDKALNRTVITVTDSVTKEIIRQIPSEEMLAIARRTEESMSTILDALG